MAHLHAVLGELVQDERITKAEVQVIRDYIQADGQLDLDDVRFLVEVLVGAKEVCPEFDELFFPILKQVVLEDGHICQAEQFYLLKMIYSDGHIRESEKKFLHELRDEATEITPDFEALLETVFEAHPTNWAVD